MFFWFLFHKYVLHSYGIIHLLLRNCSSWLKGPCMLLRRMCIPFDFKFSYCMKLVCRCWSIVILAPTFYEAPFLHNLWLNFRWSFLEWMKAMKGQRDFSIFQHLLKMRKTSERPGFFTFLNHWSEPLLCGAVVLSQIPLPFRFILRISFFLPPTFFHNPYWPGDSLLYSDAAFIYSRKWWNFNRKPRTNGASRKVGTMLPCYQH